MMDIQTALDVINKINGMDGSTYDEAVMTIESTIDRYKKALENIANPIAHMQKEAEANGYRLDGQMAIKLSNSAEHLKQTAGKALRGDE